MKVPSAFCVYMPLAIGSLANLVDRRPDILTQITLMTDYLTGLACLHGKGVMHRDIKPNNLGVVSLAPPKGVILDLDGATRGKSSDDHLQGTIPFLAPEIIRLKQWSKLSAEVAEQTAKPEQYGPTVDIWALGLSAFMLCTGRLLPWKVVNMQGYEQFMEDIKTRVQSSEDPQLIQLLRLVARMVTWASSQRTTAVVALEILRLPAKDQGQEFVKHETSDRKRRRP